MTAGTVLLSDEIVVKITSNPGETFLDHMIQLIESAKRKKSPNEVALTILLSALTFIFIVVVSCLKIFSGYFQLDLTYAVLIAFTVCLIPTTIAGLLSAIGIAGINRLMRCNVLAMSGQAVEAAGDVDIILLDKTGTITFGNRRATAFIPDEGIPEEDLLKACYLTSLEDETTEGRSIYELIKKNHEEITREKAPPLTFIPFSAETCMSGVDYEGLSYRKGAKHAIEKFVGKPLSPKIQKSILEISEKGGTPLLMGRKYEDSRCHFSKRHSQARSSRTILSLSKNGAQDCNDDG